MFIRVRGVTELRNRYTSTWIRHFWRLSNNNNNNNNDNNDNNNNNSDNNNNNNRAHTGKYEYNSRTFQGLPKASPTVYKDLKIMKNTDQRVEMFLQKF